MMNADLEKFRDVGRVREYAKVAGLKTSGQYVIAGPVRIDAAAYVKNDMAVGTIIKWVNFIKEVVK